MSEETYEMLWDCRFCSTKKLLGLTHRHCPNCGAPQDPSARYFPSDAEKVAVANHVYAGADHLCPACATPNGAKANCCMNCGSPLEAGKAVVQRRDQVHAEGQAFGAETAQAARDERAKGAAMPGAAMPGAAMPAPSSPEVPPARRRSWLMPALVLGALVLMSLLFVTCFWKKSVALTATSHAWQREVQVEQMAAVSDASWCDQLPSGASDVTRTREVRSHKQVQDGETCATRRKDNGDGTFKQVKECSPKYRDDPVYDDKCHYHVNRWVYERSEKASGTSVKDTLVWPAVHLGRTGSSIGSEREGKRIETYGVTFTDQDKSTHDCSFDQAKWARVADGSRWAATSGMITGALDCDSLQPAR